MSQPTVTNRKTLQMLAISKWLSALDVLQDNALKHAAHNKKTTAHKQKTTISIEELKTYLTATNTTKQQERLDEWKELFDKRNVSPGRKFASAQQKLNKLLNYKLRKDQDKDHEFPDYFEYVLDIAMATKTRHKLLIAATLCLHEITRALSAPTEEVNDDKPSTQNTDFVDYANTILQEKHQNTSKTLEEVVSGLMSNHKHEKINLLMLASFFAEVISTMIPNTTSKSGAFHIDILLLTYDQHNKETSGFNPKYLGVHIKQLLERLQILIKERLQILIDDSDKDAPFGLVFNSALDDALLQSILEHGNIFPEATTYYEHYKDYLQYSYNLSTEQSINQNHKDARMPFQKTVNETSRLIEILQQYNQAHPSLQTKKQPKKDHAPLKKTAPSSVGTILQPSTGPKSSSKKRKTAPSSTDNPQQEKKKKIGNNPAPKTTSSNKKNNSTKAGNKKLSAKKKSAKKKSAKKKSAKTTKPKAPKVVLSASFCSQTKNKGKQDKKTGKFSNTIRKKDKEPKKHREERRTHDFPFPVLQETLKSHRDAIKDHRHALKSQRDESKDHKDRINYLKRKIDQQTKTIDTNRIIFTRLVHKLVSTLAKGENVIIENFFQYNYDNNKTNVKNENLKVGEGTTTHSDGIQETFQNEQQPFALQKESSTANYHDTNLTGAPLTMAHCQQRPYQPFNNSPLNNNPFNNSPLNNNPFNNSQQRIRQQLAQQQLARQQLARQQFAQQQFAQQQFAQQQFAQQQFAQQQFAQQHPLQLHNTTNSPYTHLGCGQHSPDLFGHRSSGTTPPHNNKSSSAASPNNKLVFGESGFAFRDPTRQPNNTHRSVAENSSTPDKSADSVGAGMLFKR